MKLVKLGVVCGAFLLAACGGEDGATGPAGPAGADGADGSSGGAAAVESVNGISPARGFTGRTVHLSISGDNTNWSAAPTVTVDDAEVKISDVQVASPTALTLTVTIGDAAVPGIKTFSVADKQYKGFEVAFPAMVTQVLGDQAQGSLILVSLKNLDTENLFDTTSTGDGLFSPIEFVGMEVNTSAPGVGAGAVNSVTAQSLFATIVTDVDVAPGDIELELKSLDDVSYRTGKVATLAARAPQEITFGGAPLDVTIDGPFKSKLFKASYAGSPTGALLGYVADGTEDTSVFGLGTTGKWSDRASTPNFVRPDAAANAFFVVGDLSGESGYPISVELSATAFVAAAMGTSNATKETALTVGTAGLYLSELTTEADVDWFKVTLPVSNKVLTFKTKGLETSATAGHGIDTIIDLYAAADTATSLMQASENYDETLVSGTLSAGEYLIKVTSDPDYASPGATAYAVSAMLGDPPAP